MKEVERDAQYKFGTQCRKYVCVLCSLFRPKLVLLTQIKTERKQDRQTVLHPALKLSHALVYALWLPSL